jgi:hypothetical protein
MYKWGLINFQKLLTYRLRINICRNACAYVQHKWGWKRGVKELRHLNTSASCRLFPPPPPVTLALTPGRMPQQKKRRKFSPINTSTRRAPKHERILAARSCHCCAAYLWKFYARESAGCVRPGGSIIGYTSGLIRQVFRLLFSSAFLFYCIFYLFVDPCVFYSLHFLRFTSTSFFSLKLL